MRAEPPLYGESTGPGPHSPASIALYHQRQLLVLRALLHCLVLAGGAGAALWITCFVHMRPRPAVKLRWLTCFAGGQ